MHLIEKSVASKVIEVGDDIDGWWSQSTVQDARPKFYQIYARTSVNPVRELKKIFSNQSH